MSASDRAEIRLVGRFPREGRVYAEAGPAGIVAGKVTLLCVGLDPDRNRDVGLWKWREEKRRLLPPEPMDR